MLFDNLVFTVIQAIGFMQDGIGDGNFADVMEIGALTQNFDLFRRQVHGLTNRYGIGRHLRGMTANIGIASIKDFS